MSQEACKYFRAFVHPSEKVGYAEAAFMYPKNAFAWLQARGGPTTAVVRDKDGRKIVGTTSHGNAILDILQAKEDSK